MNDVIDSQGVIDFIANKMADCEFIKDIEFDDYDPVLYFKNEKGDEFKVIVEMVRHS